ncbi:resolvase [Sulfitobacter alexandrii]|uniref:Resolvase n=1 Tax=Sulfitobacter alexandrii TaxID=1917485 RepID=A0A1J0WJC1_9RHOB|nr:recombinase family protein [Sulfitobacter alexandrii]APE44410.1 resolvase [Sulfitobacter alexandrii]
MKKIRCAIYTRKSSEDGLEQEFNSLHAQREACAAYVASQKHEGWVLLPDPYDDGGLSGGSLERPALQQLLDDVASGRVDQIIVYKIDRLTRSLSDFSKIVDILDAAEASFVSVTQSFNTATSMGRLTLNMLLSFAQFEREVTAERIRDKIAASKRKGLWMGGQVPLGYDADGRTLKIRDDEAQIIRTLYDLYEVHGTVLAVKTDAEKLGLRTRKRVAADGTVSGGGAFDRGHIHHILTNPIYAGRIRHKDKVHEGQHDPIIDPERWDRVQHVLQQGAAKSRGHKTAKRRSHLCGKLFDETGDRLTPSHAKTRKGVRLRYYVSHRLVARSGDGHQDGWRLPAEELEGRVADVLRLTMSEQRFAADLLRAATADQVRRVDAALSGALETVSEPQLLKLVERVVVSPGEMLVQISPDEIASCIGSETDNVDPDCLSIRVTFQLRKRGVETKIILADQSGSRDVVLIRNVVRAHAWYERIKSGETFAAIAKTDGTSKRRIQQMIGLAFLAPDIVRDVLDGRQPIGFTSDWYLRHDLPMAWEEQRALLATL